MLSIVGRFILYSGVLSVPLLVYGLITLDLLLVNISMVWVISVVMLIWDCKDYFERFRGNGLIIQGKCDSIKYRCILFWSFLCYDLYSAKLRKGDRGTVTVMVPKNYSIHLGLDRVVQLTHDLFLVLDE